MAQPEGYEGASDNLSLLVRPLNRDDMVGWYDEVLSDLCEFIARAALNTMRNESFEVSLDLLGVNDEKFPDFTF